MHATYTSFCNGRVVKDLAFDDDAAEEPGANWAKASSNRLSQSCEESGSGYGDAPVLMAARFLKGVDSNMNTIPMLNIWTPPPDM